jgi:hypothetical protein
MIAPLVGSYHRGDDGAPIAVPVVITMWVVLVGAGALWLGAVHPETLELAGAVLAAEQVGRLEVAKGPASAAPSDGLSAASKAKAS